MEGRKHTFLACRNARAGGRFIWRGDFNAGLLQLTAVIQNIDEGYAACQVSIDFGAKQRGSLQLVFSHPMRFKNGEIGALFDGVRDAPDLVVARARVPRDLE
eukprot:5532171-Pyramimonas_sp.AAC.1